MSNNQFAILKDQSAKTHSIEFNNHFCICKILVISNSGRKLSEKINLPLIWEKLIRLEGNLATLIWED